MRRIGGTAAVVQTGLRLPSQTGRVFDIIHPSITASSRYYVYIGPNAIDQVLREV